MLFVDGNGLDGRITSRGVGSFEKLGGPGSEGHFSKKKGT